MIIDIIHIINMLFLSRFLMKKIPAGLREMSSISLRASLYINNHIRKIILLPYLYVQRKYVDEIIRLYAQTISLFPLRTNGK